MKKQALRAPDGRLFSFRSILKIIRFSGLWYISLVYISLFLLDAFLITLTNCEYSNYGDSLWLCFQSITTIGFGDMPTANTLTRVLIVVLSIISVFYLAVITGVVVAWINENIKLNCQSSELAIIDKLENLDKLSKQELKDLSDEVRSRHIK